MLAILSGVADRCRETGRRLPVLRILSGQRDLIEIFACGDAWCVNVAGHCGGVVGLIVLEGG